jgi:hypothetical protein
MQVTSAIITEIVTGDTMTEKGNGIATEKETEGGHVRVRDLLKEELSNQ